ncbi:hypothetical protein GA0115240_124230 [Streptomyces sp. DvalAA-14]|uniref:hypothetical protein n=1 Tax=unclassified Streptomyces TaxID=2593676 RepID=UPI00081B2A30|nr:MULTISPECIES: hypothetical protein [unclassified Streptomyces]MYS20974.1 hypothetical protein [Streptomyces sp. SID4948]SCD81131.1 hypothetical protein GA0115240_124230 [Streptomyces sp. DvalAA-14]
MAEKTERNSVSLGVFLAVAAHPGVPFSIIELAGRGITADAAASRWVLEVGKPSLHGFALADKLIDFGEREDQLVGLWQGYRAGEVGVVAFELRLAEIVVAMERWASVPEGPVADSSGRLRRKRGPVTDG